MGQVDYKPHIVRERIPNALESLVLKQAGINYPSRTTRYSPRRRHQDNLPMHELRLALHFVKVLNRRACFDAHSSTPSALSMHCVEYKTPPRNCPCRFAVPPVKRYMRSSPDQGNIANALC